MIEGNCKICKGEITPGSENKIKNGHICMECKYSLPECMRSNLNQYKASELAKVVGKFETPVRRTGAFYKTRSISLYDTGMEFSGVFLPYKNIKSIDMNCYPVEIDEKGNIKGLLTFKIETFEPHVQMEDFAQTRPQPVQIKRVNGKNVFLYQREMVECANLIKLMAEGKAEKASETELGKKLAEEYRKGKNEKEGAGKTNRQNSDAPLTEMQKLLKLYSLKVPFTKEDLKKRRNELLKKYHPDEGIKNDEMAKRINVGYKELLRIAN